jgi:hypothetical protein
MAPGRRPQGPPTDGYRVIYGGPPFERLPLGQRLPTIQTQDRWNTSLEGWEADIADVVAHLTSANNTIVGHVAEPSGPVTTLMSFELNEATHCVQLALLALDEFSHIAGLRAGRPCSSDAPKDEPPHRGAFFLRPRPIRTALLRASARNLMGPKEDR